MRVSSLLLFHSPAHQRLKTDNPNNNNKPTHPRDRLRCPRIQTPSYGDPSVDNTSAAAAAAAAADTPAAAGIPAAGTDRAHRSPGPAGTGPERRSQALAGTEPENRSTRFVLAVGRRSRRARASRSSLVARARHGIVLVRRRSARRAVVVGTRAVGRGGRRAFAPLEVAVAR